VGVEQLLVDVPETADDREAQDGLRRALGDPTLQLVLWREEHGGGYVDVDGHPFTLPAAGERRVATVIESEQHGRLAAFIHDQSVLAAPELLQSVAAAARLALQRNRLQTELHARLGDLERERDFIADVVNAAPAFFVVVDLDGRIIRFNDALVAASGIEDDGRVRGRSFASVFVAAHDRQMVARLVAERRAGRHEHHWLGRQTDLVVEWSMMSISDEHGQQRLLITGLDVSERSRHEAEIQRERDFLSIVGKATPSLLCVVDADGTIDERGVNLAFTTATGIDDATAIGRRFWDLVIPPEHVDAVRRGFMAAVADARETRHETPWRAADGSELIVEWWTSSLATYRPGLYLICGTDITERRRDEDEVRRSRARLVEAGDAERRRLERNLHDGAQQRLVSLSLTLRLAESSLDDPTRARALLAGAGAELSLALGELRELARGLHPAVLTDHGLGPALQALTQRSTVPVELGLDLDERLPEAVEVCIFYAVSESLANVAKYARATRAVVYVELKHDHVSVSIADDGVGGADPRRGSGLRGLADRIAALDGSLDIDSKPGHGTSIQATLPLARMRFTAARPRGGPYG
jgi:PAS domain S-box-containing protein